MLFQTGLIVLRNVQLIGNSALLSLLTFAGLLLPEVLLLFGRHALHRLGHIDGLVIFSIRFLLFCLSDTLFISGQGASNLHVQFSVMVSAISELFGGSQLSSLSDFSNFFVSEADDNIFWLEVSMDDAALSVHIVKTN